MPKTTTKKVKKTATKTKVVAIKRKTSTRPTKAVETVEVSPAAIAVDMLMERPDISTEVFDEAELASINEQNFINGAMDYSLSQLPDPTKESLTHCKECEAKIPIARRKALPGVELCIECQRDIDEEKKRKQRLQGFVFRME